MFKKILISFGSPLFLFAHIASAGDNFFLDVTPDHQHFVAVTALKNDGVLGGFADNTFLPDQKVNRAEALKIILLGSKIPEPDSPLRDPFPDVEKNAWFATFVREAKNRDIIKGTSAGKFEPTRTVNQAEALKMLLLTNEIPTSAPDSNPFTNIPKDEWFAQFYVQAKRKFLISDDLIDPNAELTRGALAHIMYRFRKGAQTYSEPIGVMSYYGDGFNGRKTSSGAIFDNSKFTAAHRTLDLGTKILVRSFTSGKAIAVEVNDRGPYVPFRNLDLAKSAFASLESPSRGLLKGEIQEISADFPTGPVEELCDFPAERTTIPRDAFEGITLNAELPSLFRKNEVLVLQGVAKEATEVTIFWNQKKKRKRYSAPVENGRFTLEAPFLETGTFNLGIIRGRNGRSEVHSVEVIDDFCFTTAVEQAEGVTNLRGEIIDGSYRLAWDASESADLFRVLFSQKQQTVEFFVHGGAQFTPPSTVFENFQQGSAEVRVFAAELDSVFSQDMASSFSESQKMDLILSQHYFFETDPEKLLNHNLASTFALGEEVIFSGTFQGDINEDAIIITPDGGIKDFPLVIKGERFTLRFTPKQMGTHIIEINSTEGIAIFNAPIYHQDFAPVLPDYFDLFPRIETESLSEVNLKTDRLLVRRMVNDSRETAGFSRVSFHEALNEVAQFRAEDMAERDYFSHTTPDGDTITELALDFGLMNVSENIAFDVNLRPAHEGLMRSGLHRQNIFYPYWKYMGIGIAQKPSGGIIMVQVFAQEQLVNENKSVYREQILTTVNTRRETKLSFDDTLVELGDRWTQKMTKEDFFGVESRDGENIQDLVSEYGFEETDPLMISLYQYSSLYEFLDILAKRDDASFLFEEQWERAGIGVYVGEGGILSVVVLLKK